MTTQLHGAVPRIVVEVLDRFGKVKHRQIVTQFPCRIGRAYDNDIILDDPHISPNHISLEKSAEGYRAVDLDSENGTFSLHPLTRHSEHPIRDNSRVRIGHTDIRFLFTDHEIPETITDHNKPSRLMILITTGFMFPLIWTCILAVFIFDNYLSSAEPVTINTHVRVALPILIFVTSWAVGWSIISKIVTHRFYFIYHAIWIGLILLISFSLENFYAFVEFSLSIDNAQVYLTLLTDFILISALLFGHLRYSTSMTHRNAKRIAITAAVVLTMFIELNDIAESVDFSNRPAFSSILKPPAFVLGSAKDVDTFFADTESLKYDWQQESTADE